jgi:diaminohydroxyphosphoribosylaminopyrimidine deaminase/5-amino-6-(5-phosphoribosylamino)uracil reductase
MEPAAMNADAAADRRWMRTALAEARRAEGQTRPNPPVGAVLVRDNRLLATGYHHAAGQPHAEVEAFAACTEDPSGATLYVTLEPCSTHGRTPPCTDRILAAGVRRVVVATVDPNPRHVGRGIEVLRNAGIAVEVDVLSKAADELLDPVGTWITTGRPFVTLKMAQSLDGAIADANGRSRWITGPRARAEVQRLRRRADAVMVGVGTVLADDPSLLCREPDAPPTLHRIVVDSHGRTPATARVLTDGHASRTVFATTDACPQATRDAWQSAGGRVWTLPRSANGRVDLCALTAKAGAEGWLHVLCEGGATLAGALVAANLVNELRLFVAPIVLGGRSANTFGAFPFPLDTAPRFRITAQRRLGPDLLITARPRS